MVTHRADHYGITQSDVTNKNRKRQKKWSVFEARE